MRLGRLDLNLLIALDHLVTLRSITRAANTMNMTQSAMSSALRRLRDYFDDPLLLQVGREMELTPRAKALKQPLRDLLVRLDMVLGVGLEFDATRSGRQFRFIVSDYTMAVLMPHILTTAAEEGATVRFALLPQSKWPHELIERGDADILITPDLFMSAEHPSEKLFEDKFVAAVWSGSRHASRPLSLEAYLNAKHVVVSLPTVGSFQADFMARMGIQRDFEVESYSFLGLAPLVVGTDRIATIHGLLGRQLRMAHALDILALPFQAPKIVEHVQWHREMSADPGIAWVRQLAARAALRLAYPDD